MKTPYILNGCLFFLEDVHLVICHDASKVNDFNSPVVTEITKYSFFEKLVNYIFGRKIFAGSVDTLTTYKEHLVYKLVVHLDKTKNEKITCEFADRNEMLAEQKKICLAMKRI